MRGFDKEGLFRTPERFNNRWNDGPECCDPDSATSEANREQAQRVSASAMVREAVAKERKINVVNLLLISAMAVVAIASILAWAGVL